MSKVKFLVDYRGVLTNEEYYLAGEVANLENGAAARLVDDGRAVHVEMPEFTESPAELEKLSRAQLRQMAKVAKIKGYSRMNRETLLDLLII